MSFAFVVIGLGAFTRLIDAGLGCPDWPGCYGHLTVLAAEHDRLLNLAYPHSFLVSYKAWAEMIHRYCAGILSSLIVALCAVLLWRFQKEKRTSFLILTLWFIVLVGYQIMLGRWTVTLQLLPSIVTQHLLGGFLILASLGLSYGSTKPYFTQGITTTWTLFIFCSLGLVLVLLQIFLGAWTSTHYAALSCQGFPFCTEDPKAMVFDWSQAFQWQTSVGLNYEGGLLSETARQTIQMAHRFGAGIVFGYWFLFFLFSPRKIKEKSSALFHLILVLFLVQIALGIANAVFALPLAVALLHNLVAAALFLTVVLFVLRAYPIRSRV